LIVGGGFLTAPVFFYSHQLSAINQSSQDKRDKISANSEETERSGREPVHTEGVCSGGKQVMFEPMSFRWVSSPCLTHLNMHPVGHVLVNEEIDDI